MTRRQFFILGIVSFSAAGLGYAARAARAAGIPSANALSYAGVLEDVNGPVNGSHSVQIALYDAAINGAVLCQTSAMPVAVVSGRFAVKLPDKCTIALGSTADAWVDVLVDGNDTGRTKIGAVPYAVEANHAVNADTAISATTATNASEALHATAADTATNATNAASAQVATSLAGSSFRIAQGAECVSCGPGCVDCKCKNNELAISGGAFAGPNALSGSQQGGALGIPVGQMWRSNCVDKMAVPQDCMEPFALCVRVDYFR